MSFPTQVRTADARRADLLSVVRWTARASGLLFASAVSATAISPSTRRASRWLYLGFAMTHAVHFAAVARYAVVTGGQNLFPGGRSLRDAGGWPTVLVIFAGFGALVAAGRTTVVAAGSNRAHSAVAGRAAIGLIGAMFAGMHLGQVRQSRWRALPATLIALSVAANILSDRRSRQQVLTGSDPVPGRDPLPAAVNQGNPG